MKLVDMVGLRVGRLVVTARAPARPGNRRVYWACRCDCGNTCEVPGLTLRRENPTRSCGCIERERQVDRTTTDLACTRPSKKHPQGRTGTAAGYLAHYYVGQEACEPCMEGLRRDNIAKAAADPLLNLRGNLWRKYRLTLERYAEILAEQGGRCAICRSESPGDVRLDRFHVDHDHACCPGNHACGRCIRGLLCRGCNTALGNFADDRARLLRAADYLNDWPGSRPAAGLKPRHPRKAARNGAEGTVAS